MPKTPKEIYQVHATAMGEAMRLAGSTIEHLSDKDIEPGDLVEAIDDIGSMLSIARHHAVLMCLAAIVMESRQRETAEQKADREFH